ncbi:hypothetical protein QR680_005888 [Steinernema hermaphroditum]|uniref:Cysteine dioxygenase n=1 Tax=Steinernema hermaphroditum TaxID=289476 RepID=A0AA39HUR6_9BILA|nr:hypothetical protein QR680_005888 [Steinernema hermaphroditum]
MDCAAGPSHLTVPSISRSKEESPEMLRQFIRRCSELCPTHHISNDTQQKLIAELQKLDFSKIGFRLPKKGTMRVPMFSSDVFENDRIHCSIFGFRRMDDVLPLHDHPDMYGFIRVIRGQIQVDSYSWLNDESLEARAEAPVVLSDQNVAVVGPSRGNVHRITALTDDAAFFDLLVPGYIDRICEYYRVAEGPDSRGVCLLEPMHMNYNFMVAYPGNKVRIM